MGFTVTVTQTYIVANEAEQKSDWEKLQEQAEAAGYDDIEDYLHSHGSLEETEIEDVEDDGY